MSFLFEASELTDEALLDGLQRAAFGYFLEAVNPNNGLVADTSRENSPCSIAVVGFALSAYPVAVERGWMVRADAVKRSLCVLRFFHDSDQSGSPQASGYKGFYYHFLDLHTGARVWRSELSMIDTALLIAGALTAGMYFTANTPEETELRELAETLYLRVDWRWSQGGAATIRQGWKPECGFLHYGWDGYNEAIVLYVLAMGSPTHPITDDCYEAWTATYQWENLYGYDFLYAGPLFVHQFSHAWIDFRGIQRQLHARETLRLFREQPACIANPARVCAAQPARIRRLRRKLLGSVCLRWPERRSAAGCATRNATRVRLCRPWRAVRTGRRHAVRALPYWRRCRSRPRSS